MSIIDELLSEIKESEFDIQMKQLCDKIMDEEFNSGNLIEEEKEQLREILKWPNVFLVNFIPSRYKKEICFICLERIEDSIYIISKWNKSIDGKYRKENVWELSQTNKAKIIIIEYVKKLYYLKG